MPKPSRRAGARVPRCHVRVPGLGRTLCPGGRLVYALDSTAGQPHPTQAPPPHRAAVAPSPQEMERELKHKGKTEETQQVERYKQLLLKQRDIMIALTARLNERDEQILTLQEELEAYDKYQRNLEDQLDDLTARYIAAKKRVLELVSRLGSVYPASLLRCVAPAYDISAPTAAAKLASPTLRTHDPSVALTRPLANPSIGASPVSQEGGRKREDDNAGPRQSEDMSARRAPSRAAGMVPGAVEVEDVEQFGGAGSGSGRERDWEAQRAVEAEIERLRRENGQMRGLLEGRGDAAMGRLDSLEKEREALKTILEQRMKTLVDDMHGTLKGLPQVKAYVALSTALLG